MQPLWHGAFLFNSLGRVWGWGVLDMGVQIATKFALGRVFGFKVLALAHALSRPAVNVCKAMPLTTLRKADHPLPVGSC